MNLKILVLLIDFGAVTPAGYMTEAVYFTERKIVVLRLMGNGDSNKVIASALEKSYLKAGMTKRH